MSSPEVLGHEGMRLRSIIREEELKKRGKSPTHFEIISASERKNLGMDSCVVPSVKLEAARLARTKRRVLHIFFPMDLMVDTVIVTWR